MRFVSLIMSFLALVSPVCFAGPQPSPDSLAQGLILPVILDHTIDARHAKRGQQISGHTTEPIPLGNNSSIPTHAKVTGQVNVAKASASGAPGAVLSLRFDRISISHRWIPIHLRTLAVASYTAVEDARVPEASPAFGDSPANWTTIQIGGDIAYHQGPIVRHDHNLGTETLYGALIDPKAVNSPLPMRLAYGEFSADAKGLYGFHDMSMIPPSGNDSLQLSSSRSNIKLNSGTELLLGVTN